MRTRRVKGRLGCRPTGQMNRTEAKFAERLMSLKLAGKIVSYDYEAVKLCIVPPIAKVRSAVYYTPDFMVLYPSGDLEMVDVKGSAGWEDTARVKIKAAAERFPMFGWVGMTLSKSGAWKREAFN